MSSVELADQVHRERALELGQSFIVQAPAGSGKTELLTLRFLKLLSVCEQPEQVLAITFTRKAASEMRNRISAALAWAAVVEQGGSAPTSELERRRFDLASKAVARDRQKGWHLLQNPTRLRVQTIDSFCFYLANQLPVLSHLGGNSRVSDDVEICFIDAINATLSLLETDNSISDDLALLLGHLDNDVNKVERLLIHLLKNRDQWLPHVIDVRNSPVDAQFYLQQSLEELVVESLQEIAAGIGDHASQLAELVNFSAGNLQAAGKLPVSDFQALDNLPATVSSALPYWVLIADMLLTKTGTWRRNLDVRMGFPPGAKQDKEFDALCKLRKQQLKDLLAQLADDADLALALDYIRRLPVPDLESEQWQILAPLTRILAQLSSQLFLSFRKFRMIDYVQASSSARMALGSADDPTDLTLALDHRIQHILVDEFQDTSQLQVDILSLLTSGWVNGDGRTLFLVGDAMQSCYGFRNANVGIYLKVRELGLGSIALTALTLQTNFRSQQGIVDWVNQVFAAAFPAHANISRGAVPYTESEAVQPELDEPAVSTEVIGYEPEQRVEARQSEAERIVARIHELQERYPSQSIAVLVRARSHLQLIIPELRVAGIQWQATDIDRLASLPVIEDLLSLTRALLNQADRLAWMALLRAPWCGLSIADLHAVASAAGKESIYAALQRQPEIAGLSADARTRLQDFCEVMRYAMSQRYRTSLRGLLENCWRLLRGSYTISKPTEVDSIEHYFRLVGEHEVGAGIEDIDEFCNTVATAFVPNRAQTNHDGQRNIHLLTMHKAKGLEFDHVLLPCLGDKSRSNEKPLLQWHRRLNRDGELRLFMATLGASDAGLAENKLYSLLRFEQQLKNQLESTRLLYIAITRARSSVYLSATLARTAKGELKPSPGSLLACIWEQLLTEPASVQEVPALAPELVTVTRTDSNASEQRANYPLRTPIRRFQLPLQLSSMELQKIRQQQEDLKPSPDADNYLQDGLTAYVGSLIHHSLEAIARSGQLSLDDYKITRLRKYWTLQLTARAGSDELPDLLQFIESSLRNTLTNPELAWLFDPSLQDNVNELALIRKRGGKLAMYRIDKTLIDQQGTRWVIDYKTGLPGQDQTESEFLDTQCVLHRQQLENYGSLFAELEQRPVQLALLFTGLGKLVNLSQS